MKSSLLFTQKLICFLTFKIYFHHYLQNQETSLLFTQKVTCFSFPLTIKVESCLLLTPKVTCFSFPWPLTIKVESCLLLTQKVTCFSFQWRLTFYNKNWKILKKIENGKFDLLLTQKLACLSFPGNVFEIGLLLFTWFSKNCLLLTWKVTCFLFLLMTFDL